MGLQKKQQSNYVRIRDGKFYLGKDTETPYDELTGKITNLSFKEDEFEGQKIRKLVLNLNDKGDEYILSFPFDSAYSSSFISFLKNADLSEELTIVPVTRTEGERTTRSLLIKQDDRWLKAYYTKDNSHGQPAMKKIVKKSGKVEWDKEDFLDFFENVIINELIPSLRGERTTEKPVTMSTDVEDEDGGDLPF